MKRSPNCRRRATQRKRVALLIAVLLPVLIDFSWAQSPARSANHDVEPEAKIKRESDAQTADEVQSLRERLTEREDENRLTQPYSVQLAGKPLILSGEFEALIDTLSRTAVERSTPRLSVFESEFEGEAFYQLSPHYSAFAQLRLGWVDALSGRSSDATGSYLERGELWIYTDNFANLGIALDAGRLAFEDDRRWWWDSELDAIRLEREQGDFALSLALAREIAATSSAADFIDPEQAKVRRVLLEASWDWQQEHAIEVFALDQRDFSATQLPGERVQIARIDEFDADLRWFGVRASGAIDGGARGQMAYWLDVAQVRGRERALEFDEAVAPWQMVSEVRGLQVRGRALDLGLTWILPLAMQPRLSLGYARGAGDAQPDDDLDSAFRQTGIEANETGFGGVQRFAQYGIVLDPELSNLSIISATLGSSVLQQSSIDLRYNRYQLRELAGALRGARIDLETLGSSANVGEAIDLVLAIEEGERFELELQLGSFRAGPAVRPIDTATRSWIWAGVLAFRAAF